MNLHVVLPNSFTQHANTATATRQDSSIILQKNNLTKKETDVADQLNKAEERLRKKPK
jgi:hypothetical protein